MALTPEELAELKQLQGMVAQLPDDNTQASPPGQPGFFESAWDNFHPVDAAKDLGAQAFDIASRGPLGGAVELGRQMVSGVDSLQSGLQRTADIAGSIIPGTRTLGTAIADLATDDIKTPGEYGKMFGEDMSIVPAMAATAGLIKGGGGAIANRRGITAAKAEAMAAPESQAALRFAENRGLLDTSSAKSALETQTLTPEIQRAASVAEGEAIALKQGNKDFLPGVALGYPENNAARSFAASEAMGEAGPVMIRSGLYEGGERINPFTGRFEGPPSAPLDNFALADKMELASTDILQARRAAVGSLDSAMQQINKSGSGFGPAKIGGIKFGADVAPVLDELRTVIDKRAMLNQTAPISAEMQGAINGVEQSFQRIKTQIYPEQGATGWQLTGTGEMGEILPSQALDLIENMNAFRRSLGEFDELSRAKGLNSTHNDFMGRAAELYSLSKVQKALQTALEGKASEILRESKSLGGYYPWSDFLAQMNDGTLASMNETFSAFQTAQEAARTFGNTTNRGMVTPEKGRLITEVKDTARDAAEFATNPRRGLLTRGAEFFLGKAEQPNMALQQAEQNLRRPKSAVSQVLDGLLLREKPVPILSRNWSNIKNNPSAMQELSNRAAVAGILPMGALQTLPEPQQQEVHKMVAEVFPDAMEQVPGGLNIINGEYRNPLEQEFMMQQAKELGAAERARIIGAAGINKYQPLVAQPPKPLAPPPALPATLERLNNSLQETFVPPPTEASYDDSTLGMLEKLTKAKSVHDFN